MASASPRSMPSELLDPTLCSARCSACEFEVSTPALTRPGASARAAAADAAEERRAEAAEPVAEACHGATSTWAGRLVPVSSSDPPLSPSPDCDPPKPSRGWPARLTTVARESALAGPAEAPVEDTPSSDATWTAVAVAVPVGATSALAAIGVRPRRRQAGAAAVRMGRRMVLLKGRGPRRRCRAPPRGTQRDPQQTNQPESALAIVPFVPFRPPGSHLRWPSRANGITPPGSGEPGPCRPRARRPSPTPPPCRARGSSPGRRRAAPSRSCARRGASSCPAP